MNNSSPAPNENIQNKEKKKIRDDDVDEINQVKQFLKKNNKCWPK